MKSPENQVWTSSKGVVYREHGNATWEATVMATLLETEARILKIVIKELAEIIARNGSRKELRLSLEELEAMADLTTSSMIRKRCRAILILAKHGMLWRL